MSQCLNCGSPSIIKALSLGSVPLAGNFLLDPAASFETYPLDVSYCNNCNIFSIMQPVSPDRLFGEYHYASSEVKPLLKHFTDFAIHTKERFSMHEKVKILEIGCNDLPFLSSFVGQEKFMMLGIDPSYPPIHDQNLVRLQQFFSMSAALSILKDYGQFDFLYAANVFAHIENLRDVLGGLKLLASDTASIIIEVHDALSLLQTAQYETIYHEHIYYHTVNSLYYIANSQDMALVDLSFIDTHGGSLRVELVHKEQAYKYPMPASLKRQLFLEKYSLPVLAENLNSSIAANIECYRDCMTNIANRFNLSAYGISGRAVMFLNSLHMPNNFFKYFIDDSPTRIGKYIPGFSNQIYDRSILKKLDSKSVLLVTAWNYADAISTILGEVNFEGYAVVLFPEPKIFYYSEEAYGSSDFDLLNSLISKCHERVLLPC